MDYSFLDGKSYEFLKTNKFLGRNICLLVFGGSIAYGTNNEDSDIDIRGIAVNPTDQIFGLKKDFEQVVDKNTDTTIYSLNKMVKLLLECNPNTMEIFGALPEHYIYINNIGNSILANKKSFLSKKAIQSFGGYANQQYNRLIHGLLGNGNNDDKKLEMLRDSLNRSIKAFNTTHKHLNMSVQINRLSTEKLQAIYPSLKIEDDNSNEHLVVNGTFTNVPVTDFKNLISNIHKIQSEYGNVNKRNTKKTDKKLANHMVHLIRLYLMGTDLNKEGKIQVYRSKEHDMLMDIKNRKYMTEDGLKVKDEFYDILKEVQDEYTYSLQNTVLPDSPDYEVLNNILLDIYKDLLSC